MLSLFIDLGEIEVEWGELSGEGGVRGREDLSGALARGFGSKKGLLGTEEDDLDVSEGGDE